MNFEELRKVGAALYLCEGTRMRLLRTQFNRKHYAIEFTNKEPRMMRVFMKFLREVIEPEEERVKAQLFVYPDLDEVRLKKYWSKVVHIPIRRFNKSILLVQKNQRFKPNPLGTLKIRYTHKEHFLKLQGIIDEVFGQN